VTGYIDAVEADDAHQRNTRKARRVFQRLGPPILSISLVVNHRTQIIG
jgi:hypothetical protein